MAVRSSAKKTSKPSTPDAAAKRDGTDAGKSRALTAALSEIEKSHGKGAIMRLGQDAPIREIEGIPSGSISLDLALGGRGFPRGRVVEIFGPESSGKTTLALHIVANAQKGGGICAFVDAEHALDPAYARKLGVDLDDLLVSQPDSGEQALEIAEMLVRSNSIDIDGGGFRSGPGAAGGARRRNGGLPRRSSRPPHVPGPSQAHRPSIAKSQTCLVDLHQPNSRKNRRDVR